MKVVAYQRAILSEALYYLVEHLTLHAHSISFPELAFPSMAALTALKKEIKMVDWHQEVRDVIREVEKNMNFIRDRRRDVTFGPKDTDKVTLWETDTKNAGTPLAKHYQVIYDLRAEQLRDHSKMHSTTKRRVLEDELAKADDEDVDWADEDAEGEDGDEGGEADNMDEDDEQNGMGEEDEEEDDPWEDDVKHGGRRKARQQRKGGKR